MKKLFLALIAASILFGCLSSNAPDPKIAELTSQLQTLQTKCDASDAANGKLQSSLDSAKADQATCDTALADSQAKEFSQEKLDAIASAQTRLESLSTNASVIKAQKNFKDMDNFGCLYYIGFNGYINSGNVTIPLGCAITIGDYIRNSRTVLNESLANQAKAISALDAIKVARAG
jgi:outer membrane murein-binding lipoprotein Lpp